jgi:GntR family carbon starvation induced transcriptional regulator
MVSKTMGAAESEARPLTRTEWAEDRLRRAIITGKLAPGERVIVEQLASEWRLSATPVREALRTLAGQGLIVLDAQRGARVAEVSALEMMEVYELRLIVEPYALRLSIEADEPAWRSRLEHAWELLMAAHASNPKSPVDLEPAHTDFHLALVAGCGSDLLVRTISLLATQALRFRTLIAPRRPGGNKQSALEHRQLCELALAGQEDEATAFLATHLSWPLLVAVSPTVITRRFERLGRLRPDLVLNGLSDLGIGIGGAAVEAR